MGLINLLNTTTLKSLKFGKDQFGGGSSSEPFIIKDIPSGEPNTALSTGGPDSILRGGLLAPIRAAEDTSRISQWFFKPQNIINGVLFTAKQNLLSRSSVKTEASRGIAYGGGVINQGVYTPLSTLTQTALGITGLHVNKFGLNPLKPTGANIGGSGFLNDLLSTGGIITYEEAVKANNFEENNQPPTLNKEISFLNNPLFDPALNLLGGEGGEFITNIKYILNGGYKNRLLNIWYDKQINKNDNPNILEYGGGPGAPLGIGKTIIPFSDQRTGINSKKASSTQRSWRDSQESKTILPKIGASSRYRDYFFPTKLISDVISLGFDLETGNQSPDNPFGFKQIPSNSTLSDPRNNNIINLLSFTQEELISEEIEKGKIKPDFRKKIIERIGNNTEGKDTLSKSVNYQEKNIETRVNLGNPGQQKDRTDYTLGGLSGLKDKLGENKAKNALDKITASRVYNGSYKSKDYKSLSNENELNDLATFYIAAYDNNPSSDKAFYMHFRAFINSFNDSYSPKWNSINYVGRGNTLYNYEGFTRDIKVGFTVMAQSKPELMPMYYKLNYLASTLAPDYTEDGFMRGTLHKLTMGAYLFEVPGIITSLTYDISEQSPWEINISNDNNKLIDNSVKELPHMINVNMSFTPIHNFLSRRSPDESGQNTPFISLKNGNGGDADGYNHYDKYYN